VMTPKDQARAFFEDLVQRSDWIIDGNYGAGWSMELRLAAADMVVFLDLPRTLCLARAIKRWLVWRGRARPTWGPAVLSG
jgi:adenylate kinase family enzyme